jgi:hypothetical protein
MSKQKTKLAPNTRVGSYMVINTECNKPDAPLRVAGVTCGFVSSDAAVEWVRKDALDTVSGNIDVAANGDPETWGSDMLICQVVRVVRAVPRVAITAAIGIVLADGKLIMEVTE